jgi:hypothetical protein
MEDSKLVGPSISSSQDMFLFALSGGEPGLSISGLPTSALPLTRLRISGPKGKKRKNEARRMKRETRMRENWRSTLYIS